MVKNILFFIVYLLNFRYSCFGQTNCFDLILTFYFFYFWVSVNRTCGSVKTPSWLYHESFLALWRVRDGSKSNGMFIFLKFWFNLLNMLYHLDSWSICNFVQKLLKFFIILPWRPSLRAMTDSLQSHDRLLIE